MPEFDGTVVERGCWGWAGAFSFTIAFCAADVKAVTAVLHGLHLADAQTVGKFLGGGNLSSEALVANWIRNASATGVPPVQYIRGAGRLGSVPRVVMAVAAWVLCSKVS